MHNVITVSCMLFSMFAFISKSIGKENC